MLRETTFLAGRQHATQLFITPKELHGVTALKQTSRISAQRARVSSSFWCVEVYIGRFMQAEHVPRSQSIDVAAEKLIKSSYDNADVADLPKSIPQSDPCVLITQKGLATVANSSPSLRSILLAS